ncbi:MAG: hypothetical protein GY778_06005 [bacterium]|nr:hypothetical protein [bacterium]
MNAWMRNDTRDGVEASRRRPATPQQFTFAANLDAHVMPDRLDGPAEFFIEATDADETVATWLDDVWWLEVLRRWKDARLTVHVLPSPAALLHPVVLHQVSMVKRIAPEWRLLAHGYLGDISGTAAIEILAGSAYDEVRLSDRPRPTAAADPPNPHPLRLNDLFSRVRQIQRTRGATRPILVRTTIMPPLPTPAPQGGVTQRTESVQPARPTRPESAAGVPNWHAPPGSH